LALAVVRGYLDELGSQLVEVVFRSTVAFMREDALDLLELLLQLAADGRKNQA
jgi:hypothetical protein